MSDGGFIQRGGWWVVAQAALMFAAFLLALVFRDQWHHPALTLTGTVLLSIAGGFGIAGMGALGRNLTPYPRPSENSKLVQRGIYALVRHPLYSSLIFLASGWALVRSSGAGLAAALALAILLDAKARREERWLRDKFPDYAAYSRRVRRLLPWIY